jgi:DNA polymerase IV
LNVAHIGLVRSVFPVAKGVRLVGVTVSKFEARSAPETEELPLPSAVVA